MMESATAVRAYTVGEIKPLLVIQQTRKFIPQTVPAYAASKYVSRFQQKHPEYSYKEATLNPTNPDNKATDWEADIVSWFSNNPDAEELVGERETTAGRQLYLGRPITIKNPDCLGCHETAEKAPRTMVDVYGPDNGFGWQVGETIGTQLVSVPMSIPVARADKAFQAFMLTLCGIFIVLLILLNVMLKIWVLPSTKEKPV
jgi:protein-histidine pros-kinase